MENKDFLTLAKYAFHKSPTGGDRSFDKLLEQSDVHFHEANGALTSMVVDTHFQVSFQEQVVPMAGIGYVASYPEFRGNGAASKLMTEILRENYDKGTIFSYLAPFSYAFYGKFGYEYVFNQKQYEIPAADFPTGRKSGLTARRLSFEKALPDLLTVFNQADNNGSLFRGQFEWDYYFQYKKQPHFAVFYDNGAPKAYVIYDFLEMTFVIHELIALDDQAKNAAYRFIASHAGAFETFSYTAPSNETLEQEMQEPSRAKISFLPYMMARIVNLSAFLKLFPVDDKWQFMITDPILPENNLTFGEGEAIDMTIGEFTKYVMRDVILREYF
jgi:predicted acetyltransferase